MLKTLKEDKRCLQFMQLSVGLAQDKEGPDIGNILYKHDPQIDDTSLIGWGRLNHLFRLT